MQKNASLLKNVKLEVDRAVKRLNGLNHLEPDYRKQKIDRVHSMGKQVRSKVARISSSVAAHHEFTHLRFELLRLVVSERIINLMNMAIANVQASSLTNVQRKTAIHDVNQSSSVMEKQMRRTRSESDVQMVYTLSANSIRGVLLRFLLRNQTNSLTQLNQKAKHAMNTLAGHDWGLTSGMMAETALDHLVSDAKEALQSKSSFQKITAAKNRFFDKIDQIAGGHGPALQALSQLTRFYRQLKPIIDKQTRVSDQVRQDVNHAVDKQWNRMLHQLQKGTPEDYLLIIHRGNLQMTRSVWTLIVKDHQKKLARVQPSNLQHDLATQIRTVSGQVRYQLKTVPNDQIERAFTQGRKMLVNVEAGKQHEIVRYQIRQSIKAVKSRLSQATSLPVSDRERAMVQLRIFKKRIHTAKPHPKLSYVHKTLQQFLKLTLDTLPQRRFNERINRVASRIHNSHLNHDQKQTLLKSLNDVQYPKVKSLRQIVKRAIATDLKANFKLSSRVTSFGYQQIQNTDPTKHYMQTFRRLGASFTWHHNPSSLLTRLDHDEQTYENQVTQLLIKISSNGYDLAEKHHAFKIMGDKLRSARQWIDRSALNPEFTRVMADRLSHQFAVRVRNIIRTASTSEGRLQITKFSATVKRYLPQTLAGIRQRDLRRLKTTSRKMDEWLRMLPSTDELQSGVKRIVTPVTASIRDTTDLVRMDQVEQDAEWKLNRLMSGFMSKFDKKKKAANQTVEDYRDQAIDLAGARTNKDRPVATRLMAISNRFHWLINLGADKGIKPRLERYRVKLVKLVRHYATKHLLREIDHRYQIINQQLKSGSKFKIRAVSDLRKIRYRLSAELQAVNVNQVPKVVESGQNRLEKIEQRIVDQDPTKRHARRELARLSNHMTKLVAKLDRKPVRKELGSQLKKQVTKVDTQLQNAADYDVKGIYDQAHQALLKINVKLVRNVQLQKLSHKIDRMNNNVTGQMKLLNTPEVRDWRAKLNRSYHKAVYLINQVNNERDYVKIERSGERQIDQVYAKVKHWSDTKDSTYKAINDRVQVAKSELSSIQNLHKKEWRGSHKLFKQIMLQARAKLIQARSIEQVITAKVQCELLIQNVTNKIHTASILVTQIRKTHSEVENSTMDKAQKKSALNHINRIINSDLSNIKQATKAEESAKANPEAKKAAHDNVSKHSAPKPQSKPTKAKAKPKHFRGLRKWFHKIF